MTEANMATTRTSPDDWLTSTPDVLDGKTRIDGRRLSAHFIGTQVEGRGLSVTQVAEQYDVPTAAVRAAVEYYRAHPEEMNRISDRRAAVLREAERDSSVPTTPSELADMVAGSRSASD